MSLREEFETGGVQTDLWPQVYGADTTTDCPVVVAGHSLTFYQVRTIMLDNCLPES